MKTSIQYATFNKNPALFNQDPSVIYRCINMAAGLQKIGIRSTVNHWTQMDLNNAQAVVLHRPRMSFKLKYKLHQLRRRNTLIIADIDDFIFDHNYAKYSPAVSHGILPLKKVERAFKSTLNALALVDVITVSTKPIADKLQQLLPDKPVFIIHNCVHFRWRESNLPITALSECSKILTYTPGTRSHDYDFSCILEAVENFLFDHPNVQLRITGPLGVNIKARPDQIIYQQKLPFSDYMNSVRSGWINLMPLEQTPFNECKSALKAIEAGYWGIPTLCSPSPDVERLTAAGAIIANNKDEWYAALDNFLDDNEYARIANGLREKTLSIADIDQQAQTYKKHVLGL